MKKIGILLCRGTVLINLFIVLPALCGESDLSLGLIATIAFSILAISAILAIKGQMLYESEGKKHDVDL